MTAPVSYYEALKTADFGALETLAQAWKAVHDKVENLDDKVRDEVLKPLKDKGYWEGMAAPYAWAQIDDIQRQVTAAAKVVDAVRRSLEDGAGELKAAQTRLRELVAGLGKDLFVDARGEVHSVDECNVDAEVSKKAKKTAEGPQKELDMILRDAYMTDQNLAVTLMDNIGPDLWFNGGKVRTDINHTSGISTDRFDQIGRELKGLDPDPQKNHLTPRTLLTNWVAGTGDDMYQFSQHDPFVEQLRTSESMDKIRGDTLEQWKNGQAEGRLHHRISGQSFMGQVGTYAKDMSGLSGLDNLWGGDTNEAQSLLGSYDIDYEVKGTDPDGKLVVQYSVKNDTDMESFIPGYQKAQQKLNHDSGPAADIKERMVWTERIDPADR
ncbi:hypothetical protein [Streptomyces cucumeris]|uniref:hypothetical protein n=1 Tax=Streptomyces cucumeris TaxID=2962890 RepID=UPI003D76354D